VPNAIASCDAVLRASAGSAVTSGFQVYRQEMTCNWQETQSSTELGRHFLWYG